MTTNQTHTVAVECSCKACKAYATKNKLPFPIRALATPGAAATVPARNLVHAAHSNLVDGFAYLAPSIPA